MLAKGQYEIINIINISMSLQQQKNKLEEGCKMAEDTKSLYKAALSMDDCVVVAYFVDHIVPGKMSVIRINNDMEHSLLRKNDYTVVEQRQYSTDKCFIEKLLKKREEKNKNI